MHDQREPTFNIPTIYCMCMCYVHRHATLIEARQLMDPLMVTALNSLWTPLTRKTLVSLPCNWRLIIAVMLPDSSPFLTTSNGLVSLSSARLATQWPLLIPDKLSLTWGPTRWGQVMFLRTSLESDLIIFFFFYLIWIQVKN